MDRRLLSAYGGNAPDEQGGESSVVSRACDCDPGMIGTVVRLSPHVQR